MTDGRTLRVGVTGHRRLASPDQVAREVDRVLDRLISERGSSTLTVVSSLAEGADRIVAERVLARERTTLHAVLPLEPSDYASDFADDASRKAFTRLLAVASSVDLSPRQESREAAYEHAGRVVLAGSDVLLALWDGQPSRGRGGTAQLVTEASATDVPVEIIQVERAADAPTPS